MAEPEDRYSWKTKLHALLTDYDGNTYTLTPLQSLVPTFTTPADEFDSIEAERRGWILRPARFSFNLTIFATGDVVFRLQELQKLRKEFQLSIVMTEPENGKWTFESLVFSRCIIVGSGPSNITPTNIPTATFNCKVLEEPQSVINPLVIA